MATTFGKPYSLILLELEEQVCGKGDTRPLIVEAAYRKIIKEYGDNLSADERITLGALRIIFEEVVGRNDIQANACREIRERGPVQRWGAEKVKGWTSLLPEQQVARVFLAVTPSAKDAASKIIYAEGKQVDGSNFRFDFEDPDATLEKISKVFLEDITKQSEVLP